MIAADTSRSRAYLQALVRNNFLPNYVLVLGSTDGKIMPGQIGESQRDLVTPEISGPDGCWSEARFDLTKSIIGSLADVNVPYDACASQDINDPSVVEEIRRRPESVFIYSGFGGSLLRKGVLETGKRFLHVHGGYLPAFKGSTTNYYSLLTENALGASSLFLTSDIDSGPVLVRRKFPPPEDRRAIDHIYDSGARAKVLIETIRNYVKCGDWEFELPNNIGGETYYIIHPVLKHIAILEKGCGAQCE